MAATQHSSLDFRVGNWLIQPRLSRIEGDGGAVRVTPKAMAVLVYLAEKQSAVVSRNELLDAIWPRMAVTQDALSQCLVELRKAFGDDPKNPRVIETIPKVGVRLIGPISTVQRVRAEEPPPEASNGKTTRRWSPANTAWLTAAPVALVGVALLIASFYDRANPAASERNQLALEAANPEARELYLSAVGEYSTRPERRTALLYEEELLQRAVEKDPSFALAWARLGRTHTAFYFFYIDRTANRLALAKHALDTALTLDPELPEGHLFLGNYLYRGRTDYDGALAELAIAEKSLAADPDLHLIRASIHRALGEWTLALEEGQKTVDLDRTNPFHWRQLFVTQMTMRDYARADATLDGSLALQPDDVIAHSDKVLLQIVSSGSTELAHRYDAAAPAQGYRDGRSYGYTRWLAAIFDRDYGKARAVLEELPGDDLFDVDLQSSPSPKSLLYARTHSLAGDNELARAEYESVVRATLERLADPVYEDASAPAALYLTLAEAQAGLGHEELAREAARRARDLVAESPTQAERAGWNMAYALRVLLPLGDEEAALNELESYLSKPGIWSIEGLQRDPRLDPIRDDPRFTALVETYGRD